MWHIPQHDPSVPPGEVESNHFLPDGQHVRCSQVTGCKRERDRYALLGEVESNQNSFVDLHGHCSQ